MEKRKKHHYVVKRSRLGNTVFSLLKEESNLLKVLNYVLEEAALYNGSLFTNKNRLLLMEESTKINKRSLYEYLIKLEELKILLKPARGEYSVNPYLIQYINNDDNE